MPKKKLPQTIEECNAVGKPTVTPFLEIRKFSPFLILLFYDYPIFHVSTLSCLFHHCIRQVAIQPLTLLIQLKCTGHGDIRSQLRIIVGIGVLAGQFKLQPL